MTSTLNVAMKQAGVRVQIERSGTMGVMTEWRGPLQTSVEWSIKLGIDQAARNEGTMFEDADIGTDDD